ncbi:MAG: 6-pyruvoyl-tetrahydropterin synthase-related protein [Anaerolineae bacterium]|nr:6-pyruvoyl-tetrahydropterin synthase-related protein [Anaerolineae bacterium]
MQTSPIFRKDDKIPARQPHRNENVFWWLLALMLPAFAIWQALVYPIEEHAVDAALFHIYRAVVFSTAVADGQVYPRWVPAINGGLGGPIFTFYSPLIYFLMAALHAVGIPFALTWRAVVALTFLAASAGMLGLGLALFHRAEAALAAAAVYVYAPYLLKDLFERGSPQGAAIALLPWMLWALLALTERPSGFRLALAAAAWAALILTHNATALLTLPVLALFLLFVALKNGLRGLLWVPVALTGGLSLAAFFLIPFMAERSAVQLQNASASQWTSLVVAAFPLTEFFGLPPVFDVGRANNTIGNDLGLLTALLLPTALALSMTLWRDREKAQAIWVGGLALWSLVALWLQTPSATPIWEVLGKLSVMAYLNFRWRLLCTVGLAVGVAAGALVASTPARWRGRVAATIVVLALALTLPFLYPNLLAHHASVPRDPTPQDVLAFTLRTGFPDLSYYKELLPRWRTVAFSPEEAQRIAESPISNLPEGGRVLRYARGIRYLEAELETPVGLNGAFHVLYFPGWAGYVDGKPVPIRPAEGSGYVLLDVPAGRHTVVLRYEGTAAQRVGGILSGVTALGLLLVALLWRGRPASVLYPEYPRPRWWALALLAGLGALKGLYLDPHTTFLRRHSTCQSTHGAQVQTDIWFGDILHLCGYAVSSHRVRPGDELTLTLFWEIPRKLDRPANSFVHLIGPTVNPETGTPLWGQEDKQMAINWWSPGRIYKDDYTFRVWPTAPPGEYRLEVGWWDPETEARYPPRILSGEDVALSEWNSLLISRVVVVP